MTTANTLMLQAAVQLTMSSAQWFMVLLLAPAVAFVFVVIAAVGAYPLIRALEKNIPRSAGK